jgi:hypothetical protein
LSKITKLPLKTWCDYRPTLQDFFHEGWRHKRIDAELARMVRVSEKRAIAGQKGGLGSALARMKLENASRSRQGLSREALSRDALSRGGLSQEGLPRAIAALPSSVAAAAADHAHSNSHQSLPGGESQGETRPADPSPPPSGGRREKPAIAVSPELAAYVARRTT